MRSHREIVWDFQAASLVRALAARGVQLNITTPQRWADRNSIPAKYWGDIVALGAATLEELAACAPAPAGSRREHVSLTEAA